MRAVAHWRGEAWGITPSGHACSQEMVLAISPDYDRADVVVFTPRGLVRAYSSPDRVRVALTMAVGELPRTAGSAPR